MKSTDQQTALLAICRDAVARRELLWLRAMEHDDEVVARDLERVQPGLQQRMRQLVAVYDRRLGACASRRDSYSRVCEDRLTYHAERLTAAGA